MTLGLGEVRICCFFGTKLNGGEVNLVVNAKVRCVLTFSDLGGTLRKNASFKLKRKYMQQVQAQPGFTGVRRWK